MDCDWVTLYDGPDSCCILLTTDSRVTDFTLLDLSVEDFTETGAVIFSATPVELDGERGSLRRFAIAVSGYDGSLLLEEADPLETQFILPGEISR